MFFYLKIVLIFNINILKLTLKNINLIIKKKTLENKNNMGSEQKIKGWNRWERRKGKRPAQHEENKVKAVKDI